MEREQSENNSNVYHPTNKIDVMIHQMLGHKDPYRLVYKWVLEHHLSFKEFMELMKTYEHWIKD